MAQWRWLPPVVLLLASVAPARADQDCALTSAVAEELSSLSASLSSCLSLYAAPALFCEKCADQYELYTSNYAQLPDNCRNFGALASMHTALTGVWATAQCTACAAGVLPDFRVLAEQLNACIAATAGRSVVCEYCKGNLTAVDTFHDKLPPACQNNGDIVDQYRRLAETWATLQCPAITRHERSVFALMGFLLALPFAFYLFAFRFLSVAPKPGPVLRGVVSTDQIVFPDLTDLNTSARSGAETPPRPSWLAPRNTIARRSSSESLAAATAASKGAPAAAFTKMNVIADAGDEDGFAQ